jgi:membrane associated rhomboid family serine protease
MRGQFFPYKDENPHRRFPIITLLLVLVNIGVFVWSLQFFTSEDSANAFFDQYGFTPAYFSFFTILTSMFLHGGIGHIFGNMWYMWLFGDNVEDRFGRLKFVLFYLAAGLFAALTHFIVDPSSSIPAIGASGAISGVLGAYMALFPKVKVKTIGFFYQVYELPAWALMGIWFALQIFSGALEMLGGLGGGGIAFFAHIGGFIFGFLVGLVYNKWLWGSMRKSSAAK